MCRRSKAFRGESHGQEGRWRRSHSRPFERRLIELSPDLVVEGRLWRRWRDQFWAVLGPWHRDRIAISNKTPARCRMGSGEEERLCGVAGYRDPARAPENLRKPMNQARRATSGIAGRQWQQVEGLTAKEACEVMRVK